jgi:acyl-CoA dehydrogenase
VIAAKGYEQDTYFEMALRDIGMLPKLEGTEHVNMALIIKFVRNYFFGPLEYPEVPMRSEAGDDSYLFHQYTGGLAKIKFPDYRVVYEHNSSPNIDIFREQVELFRSLLIEAPPTEEQTANIDYMLAAGELFTLVVYAQLILEKKEDYPIDEELLEEIFRFLIVDYSRYALEMSLNYENTETQQQLYGKMIKRPVSGRDSGNVFNKQVMPLRDSYQMKE